MFLFERIIGVGIYFFITIIFSVLISKSSIKKIGIILFFLNIIIGILAFFYLPSESADLYRLTIFKNQYSIMTFEQIKLIMEKSSTPIAILYLYLIGKLKYDGFLPMITSLIFFGNSFAILTKFSKRYSIKPKNISIGLLFFLSSGVFIEVISGIRSMLAFSILAMCIYNEFIDEKPIIYDSIWYLIASLMHPVALVLTIIRFIFIFFEGSKSVSKIIFNFTIFIISFILVIIYGDKYINSTIDIIKHYIGSSVYRYVWEYIIGFFMLIVIINMLIYYSNNIKKYYKDNKLNKLYKFSCLITTIIIIMSFEYSTFHRFILLLSILVLPILLIDLEFCANFNNKKYNFRNFVIFMSITILFFACFRGNLSGLKFFILN
ncbi:EpsG family protein [Clostridium perfringens]|uniref:EpsG family protein n=1 Tax=Clostridium perfringens TaxID=1502 RepID=A0AAW9IZ91_CLOPF|nr:EpsG family protein [Clostridium perfringens]EJT6500044.1 EpsG family protein [Clostridium perfringens]MDZ5032851.1 hypothetical protein [Clostridium perfringens]